MVKRLLDIVLSLIGIIALSPLFAVLAIVIKLESKGQVFYRGERVGRYGRNFRIFKFRSMIRNAEKIGAASTTATDMRVTRCGKFIRKYKLDELSQLFNVLIGDMSIVGPRPEVRKFVNMYTDAEKTILTIRPGITDWASIKFYNEGEIIEASGFNDPDEAYTKLIRPEKLCLQLKYVQEHNLWIDLKIIFATLLTIVSTRTGGQPVGVPVLPGSGVNEKIRYN